MSYHEAKAETVLFGRGKGGKKSLRYFSGKPGPLSFKIFFYFFTWPIVDDANEDPIVFNDN